MLEEINAFEAKGKIEDIALGDELIGIGSITAQVFTKEGELVYEINANEEVESVDFKDDFFFLTWSGKIFVEDRKVSLGEAYNRGLKVLDDSLIACGRKCGKFDLSGNPIWDIYIGWTDSSPAVFEEYVYVADHTWNSLLILNNGKIKSKIEYGEGAWGVDVCNKTLVVTTEKSIIIYHIENPEEPEEIISLSGFGLAWRPKFSRDCNAVAVLDRFKRSLLVLNNKGNIVSNINVPSDPTALDWGKELVLGQYNGSVTLYNIKMKNRVEVLLDFENVFYFHKHEYPFLVLPISSKYAEIDGKRYAVMRGLTPLGPFSGLKKVIPLSKVNTTIYIGIPNGLDRQGTVDILKELKVPLFEGAVVEINGSNVVVEKIEGALSAWPSDSLIVPRTSTHKGKIKVARVSSWTTG